MLFTVNYICNIDKNSCITNVVLIELELTDVVHCYRLIEKNSLITSDKQLFGKSGSDYDFISRDPYKE